MKEIRKVTSHAFIFLLYTYKMLSYLQ